MEVGEPVRGSGGGQAGGGGTECGSRGVCPPVGIACCLGSLHNMQTQEVNIFGAPNEAESGKARKAGNPRGEPVDRRYFPGSFSLGMQEHP